MENNSLSVPGRVTGLAHVALYTPDVEKSVQFYHNHLGFEFLYDKLIPSAQGTTKLVLIQNGSCTLELVQPADPSEASGKPEGVIPHLALAVEGIEDLAASLRKTGIVFETNDIRIASGHRNGAKVIFFRGPSGERIELFEYL